MNKFIIKKNIFFKKKFYFTIKNIYEKYFTKKNY